MKPLEHKFTLRGWQFEQVMRSEHHAIFRKRKSSWAPDKWSFEVIRIRKNKAGDYVIAGRPVHCEAKETMPSDAVWGSHGWTYTTREKAVEKFDALVATEEEQP